MKFYAQVVMYNTSVENSVTCKGLRELTRNISNLNVIIADNSTIQNNNEILSKEYGWEYINMGGNLGISKAYNRTLDYLKSKNAARKDVVIWLDDDSAITAEYFFCLRRAIYENPRAEIFAPIMMGQDGVIHSPNNYNFFKDRKLKSANDEIFPDRYNAINSCTAVKLSVYESYRYDERLFLDQVDHKFFKDQRDLRVIFSKLDVIINHDLSVSGRFNSIEQVKTRYEIMIPDYLVFCEKSRAKKLLGYIKIAGWGLRESFKYNSSSFFFWCIKKAFASSNHKTITTDYMEGE